MQSPSMASLRYTCSCTRYLSPTRLGSSSNQLHQNSPSVACWHSAPTSPINRWRSKTSSATLHMSTSSDTQRDVDGIQTQSSTTTSTTKLSQVLQNKLLNLRVNSLANSIKDISHWTMVRAPKLDAKSVAKLIASLNIDLPRYQRWISNSTKTLPSSNESEIERVKREQKEEKKVRLLEKTCGDDVSRESHNFEEAMLSIQESIQGYYSNDHHTFPSPKLQSGPEEVVTKDNVVMLASEGSSSVTQATLLERISNLSKVLPSPNNKENSDKVSQQTVKSNLLVRGAIDRRTRGLMVGLKKATLSSSRLTRLEALCDHLMQYPEMGKNVATKEKIIPCLLRLRASSDEAISGYSRQALTLLGYTDAVKGRGVRILTIDGGGTRGLIAIEMLRKLTALTGKPVHEMFDYICGVSTGALIATMVGIACLPLDECETLYEEFSLQMFARNRLLGASKLVTTHAYYDSQLWEKILQENIGIKKYTEVMKDPACTKLAVVSTLVNQPRMENFLFRNYCHSQGVQSHYPGSVQHHLWEAIRASSAAPGYYEEFKLGSHMHQDGGLLTNNPTAIAIHECKLLWPTENIQCVISIGTGRYRPNDGPAPSYSLKDKLLKVVQSATDTEAVHTILNDLLPPSSYFRFNPYLSDDFLLDEIEEERWDMMKQDVQMYCRKNETKLVTAANHLIEPKMVHQKASEWLKDRLERIG